MLKLENVKKSYDGTTVLDGINLEIEDGEIVSILGPSGCGKTTLLNLILGITDIDSGKIIYNGEDMTECPMEKRGFNIVFQDYALFPNLNVYQNITYGLKNKPNISTKEEVEDLIDLLGLREHLIKKIDQLSGGQKQRVAIARALANNPKVLLCDEATSALDPQTTQSILQLIKKVNKEFGLTVILITHEMAVVKEVCDKVAVMEDGRVVEQGSIVDIFSNPQHQITKNFIATTNNLNKIDELIKDNHRITQLNENQQMVKLQYQSSNTDVALISVLSRDYSVDCSIIFGNVEIIQGQPIGTLITIFTGEDVDIKKALEFTKQQGVKVEVIKRGN